MVTVVQPVELDRVSGPGAAPLGRSGICSTRPAHGCDGGDADNLTAAGVPCELVTVPGMYHGADGLVQKAASMRDFHASMVEFLRTYLDAGPTAR